MAATSGPSPTRPVHEVPAAHDGREWCVRTKTSDAGRVLRARTGKIPGVIRLHSIGVRVYYEDTDAGGIVYYANYLRFFERARTDWLRAAGITHQDLSQVQGLNLVVRECAVQYLRPARLDDLLSIDVGVADPAADIGRASLRLTQRAVLVERGSGGAGREVVQEAVRDAACDVARDVALDRAPGPVGRPPRGAGETGAIAPLVLATGTVRVACLAASTGRPVPLPPGIMRVIAEQVSGAGQPQDQPPAAPSSSAQVITRVTPDGTTEEQ